MEMDEVLVNDDATPACPMETAEHVIAMNPGGIECEYSVTVDGASQIVSRTLTTQFCTKTALYMRTAVLDVLDRLASGQEFTGY
jgi:hypothetical protein